MATLKDARRVVVKIGSSLLVGSEGSPPRLDRGTRRRRRGAEGRGADVIPRLPRARSRSAGAAPSRLPTGPCPSNRARRRPRWARSALARAWEEALGPHGLTHGAGNFSPLRTARDRRRYLNSRATPRTASRLRHGAGRQRERHHRHRRDPLWRQRPAGRPESPQRWAPILAVLPVGRRRALYRQPQDRSGRGTYRRDHRDHARDRGDWRATRAPGLARGGMKTKLIAARTAMAGGRDPWSSPRAQG